MDETKTLSKAIKAGYAVRRPPNFEILNQYWQYCTAKAWPLVAITVHSPRAKYATVEVDLYDTSIDGFPSAALYEILHFLLAHKLKPGSTVSISPRFVHATVALDFVISAAKFFYQSAIDEGICLPQKELIELHLERAGTGQITNTGPRFSFEVRKRILKEASTKEFWEALQKSNCARPPRPKGRGMLRAARPV